MLSKSADQHNLPRVPVVTTDTRTSTPVTFMWIATHSCARATASACLPGAIWTVVRKWIMGLYPMTVCVRRTPPARPCVWSSVPCWSTGDTPYPHSQRHAWKRNRPAITWMNRADSQWVCGSGVAPDLVVPGVGNEWGSTVTVFLSVLRAACLELPATWRRLLPSRPCFQSPPRCTTGQGCRW